MAGSLNGRRSRSPIANREELKRHTPEQSKRYQAQMSLSTLDRKKNAGIERKYDISILGNIYIWRITVLKGLDIFGFSQISSMYKAIY
jgi:hypothetical protein